MTQKLMDRLREKQEDIMRIAESNGARNLKVFGSVARGEEGPESDIDLLVEMEPERNLLDMGRLLMDLQDFLGCKVNIVGPEGLHWYIRKKVLSEAVT
jgi:predicted nucleotidyltransferase